MLAVRANRLELAPSISEIRIDLESGFVFSFCLSAAPRIRKGPAQFVVGDIIVWANRQAIAIKRDRLLAIRRLLRFVKIVAKGALAILLFLVLNLLPGGEGCQFLALARNLLFLLTDLPRLSLQHLGVASRRRDHGKAEENSVAEGFHSLFDITQAEINFLCLDR
jgi:hypothetical protein